MNKTLWSLPSDTGYNVYCVSGKVEQKRQLQKLKELKYNESEKLQGSRKKIQGCTEALKYRGELQSARSTKLGERYLRLIISTRVDWNGVAKQNHF